MKYSLIHRAAFTLVELSIVLVIVALLIGGIIAGKNMIRAAELRSVMTDANQYITAINTFKSQYRGLPGDITNATNYWGASSGPGADTSGTTLTQNGNGDGQVYYGYYVSSNACTWQGGGPPWESNLAWKHMSNAGFVKGDFSNTVGPAATFVPGKSQPASRIPNVGFSYMSGDIVPAMIYKWLMYTANSTAVLYTMTYGNALFLGELRPGNSCATVLAAFTPEEAYTIDTKMDDGLPASGNWIASLEDISPKIFGNSQACTLSTSATDFSAATNLYNVSATGKVCSFIILTGT